MIKTLLSWVLVIIVVLAFSAGPSAATNFAMSASSVASTTLVAVAKGVAGFVKDVNKNGVLVPGTGTTPTTPKPSTPTPATRNA